MAYNNYYPATYQPYNPQYYYQQNVAQNQQATSRQINQSGFVLVPSEQEARVYPVAPGNSITFKDENAPFCYVKTMGFNQLDQPTFEKYRLVKEESVSEVEKQAANVANNKNDTAEAYVTKKEISAILIDIDKIKQRLNDIEKGGLNNDDE